PKPAPPPPVRPPAGPPAPPMPIPAPKPKPEEKEEKEVQDGALMVPHDGVTGDNISYATGPEQNIAKIHIDDEGVLKRIAEEEAQKAAEEKAKQEFNPAPNPVALTQDRKIVGPPSSVSSAMSA